MFDPYFYEPSLTVFPEPKAIGACQHCREEIYEGDEILLHEEHMIHEDCAHDYALSYLLNHCGARFSTAEDENPNIDLEIHEILERGIA